MRRRHPLLGSRGVLTLLCLFGVAAVAHAWSPHEGLALHLYTVPVLFGASLYGRRGGIYATVIAIGIMVGIAVLARTAPAADPAERWLAFGAWAALAVLIAWVAGGQRDRVRRRSREIHDAYLAFRDALAQLVFAMSGHVEEHRVRIADRAARIAETMGQDAKTRDDIHAAALLGSFAASDTTMNTLARAAGVIARSSRRRSDPPMTAEQGFLETIASILCCVRERWDGTGQLGLARQDIPYGARVITVATAFDAAAHGRASSGVPTGAQAAVDRLVAGRGSQFDPEIVDVVVRGHAGTTADDPTAESTLAAEPLRRAS